jgi:hypothetical protein
VWLRDDRIAPEEIAVNPSDGSVWVVDGGRDAGDFGHSSAVVHYAADGTELWRSATFNQPQAIEFSPSDGTVWVSDWQNGQMVHLKAIYLPFSDVGGDCWAWDGIWGCYSAGVVEGYPDGSYQPATPVTRDQMAVYVARGMLAPTGEAALAGYVPSDPRDFPDVPDTSWAWKHVEYCAEQGIVEGYEDGYYRPEWTVTRDQMAAYTARALVAPAGEAALANYVPSDPRDFPDVPPAFWARKHVEYCAEQGVVEGYEDGYYHPEWAVTRDQMAVYVARAFRLGE